MVVTQSCTLRGECEKVGPFSRRRVFRLHWPLTRRASFAGESEKADPMGGTRTSRASQLNESRHWREAFFASIGHSERFGRSRNQPECGENSQRTNLAP